MNVVLGSISGSIIGFITASIVRPPYPYFKFTVVQIGIGMLFHSPSYKFQYHEAQIDLVPKSGMI